MMNYLSSRASNGHLQRVKRWLVYLSVAALSACGSQEAQNGANAKLSATPSTEQAQTATAANSSLIQGLESSYPNGQLPAERSEQAATELAQNPAVLQYTAPADNLGYRVVSGLSGVVAQIVAPSPSTAYVTGLYKAVKRYRMPDGRGYLFTSNEAEITFMQQFPDWVLEGDGFFASSGVNPGLSPVYRFRNLMNGSYLYTINEAEKQNIIDNFSMYFVQEGASVWYASAAPAVGFSPLYRFRNKTNGSYLFTASEAEKNAIVTNFPTIFTLEGIGYYVAPTAPVEMQLDVPVVISKTDVANNAYKAKMGWISYKTDPALPQYDVKAQIMVYADGAAGGQNIYVARSTDNGATWTEQKVTTSGTTIARLVTDPVTSTTGNFTINHNKPNIYVAPIGVINAGKGADALLTWTSSDCSDTGNVAGDLAGPVTAQRINTVLNQPFMCLWTARSVDGGVTWVKQRLTDGSTDPDEDVPAGYVKYTSDTVSTGGFAISYQADPAGLKLGEAEGPGEGASGASVNPGTNIWYTFLSKAAFENTATPFPVPTSISDNVSTADGAPGASRANLAISGGTAVLAYEETKGGGSSGKQIIYHSFLYNLPDANSAGTPISNPANNARRVRFLLQGNEALTDGGDAGAANATTKGVHVLLMWRETSLTTAAAASDIMVLRGIRNTALRPGSTGFLPTDIESYTLAKNLSDPTANLGNDDNSLAQRGVLRGEFAAIAYDRTPSQTQANLYLDTYNLFITRSIDGGSTWGAPVNMSNITDNTIRVVEPRLVGTPGTIKLPNGTATSDLSDVQNGNILYVGWGTEENKAVSLPLDIYITRSLDKGASYVPVQLLAEGVTEQSEAQLRSTPDGKTGGALWMQRDATANTTDVVYRNFH